MDLAVGVSATGVIDDAFWAAGVTDNLELLSGWAGDILAWFCGTFNLSSDTHAVAAAVVLLPDGSGLRNRNTSRSSLNRCRVMVELNC